MYLKSFASHFKHGLLNRKVGDRDKQKPLMHKFPWYLKYIKLLADNVSKAMMKWNHLCANGYVKSRKIFTKEASESFRRGGKNAYSVRETT